MSRRGQKKNRIGHRREIRSREEDDTTRKRGQRKDEAGMEECEHCNKSFLSRGIAAHRAACARKKRDREAIAQVDREERRTKKRMYYLH